MILEAMIYGSAGVYLVEENGRKYWSVSVPDPGGWVLPQEFCTQEEAVRYAEEALERNRAYRAKQGS